MNNNLFNEKDIFTVSEITGEIKFVLEEEFGQVSVIGELSNFKKHISGHWYFTLKDSDAQISCTMWKGFNNYVFFSPQDGMKVIVTGRITVYPPRGNYQLDVRSMKPAGVGELQAAFDALKQKLSKEGLFDEDHKKEIPQLPKKIGIATSIDGAAFRDMISIAERRFPIVELVIAPCKVQGSGAAESIVESIKLLNKQSDIDLIIIGRGGGSIEDLWAFNEEIVAREIYKSKIPIISAVGHEIDFTISDFVADLRAPTPSAAMEIATPDQNDFFVFIDEFSYNSTQILNGLIRTYKKNIFSIISSYGFRTPQDLIFRNNQKLDNLIDKNELLIEQNINEKLNLVSLLESSLQLHDIKKVLKKGFSLAKQDSYITRKENLNYAKPLNIIFYDGEIETLIKNEKEKR